MRCEKAKQYFGCAKEKLQPHLICNERALFREAVFAASAYTVVLFWALWLKFNDFYMVVPNYKWLSQLTVKERFLYDLIPFKVHYDFDREFVEMLANGIVFAPFGVLFHYIFQKKNIWRDVAICFGISLSIEIVQLFTIIGNFATADLIMNTLGYFVGLAFYALIFSKPSLKTRVWICRVSNVILLITLIFVIVSTVNNWHLIVAILTRTL